MAGMVRNRLVLRNRLVGAVGAVIVVILAKVVGVELTLTQAVVLLALTLPAGFFFWRAGHRKPPPGS